MGTIIILAIVWWLYRVQNEGKTVVDDSADNWMKL